MSSEFLKLAGIPTLLVLAIASNVAGQKPGHATKPRALAVVVRQIDQIVERCIIDPAYWETTTEQTKTGQDEYDACLQTINASAILTRVVKMKLRVQSVKLQDDGTIEVSGTVKVRSKPRDFYRSGNDKKELRDFQEETIRITEDHRDRIAYLQDQIARLSLRSYSILNLKRRLNDESKALRRVTKDRRLELAEVNRRINVAAGTRKEAYERVDAQIVILRPYSSRINRAKLAQTKRAHFVVRSERLTLQRPIDDLDVRSLVGSLEAVCIEIEEKFRLP